MPNGTLMLEGATFSPFKALAIGENNKILKRKSRSCSCRYRPIKNRKEINLIELFDIKISKKRMRKKTRKKSNAPKECDCPQKRMIVTKKCLSYSKRVSSFTQYWKSKVKYARRRRKINGKPMSDRQTYMVKYMNTMFALRSKSLLRKQPKVDLTPETESGGINQTIEEIIGIPPPETSRFDVGMGENKLNEVSKEYYLAHDMLESTISRDEGPTKYKPTTFDLQLEEERFNEISRIYYNSLIGQTTDDIQPENVDYQLEEERLNEISQRYYNSSIGQCNKQTIDDIQPESVNYRLEEERFNEISQRYNSPIGQCDEQIPQMTKDYSEFVLKTETELIIKNDIKEEVDQPDLKKVHSLKELKMNVVNSSNNNIIKSCEGPKIILWSIKVDADVGC